MEIAGGTGGESDTNFGHVALLVMTAGVHGPPVVEIVEIPAHGGSGKISFI
jgi:hypothetical protein